MSIFDRKISEKEFYSDFDIDFLPDWDRDISKKGNARAVSQALVNIVTTVKGSMPFDPDYGTTIGSDLFRNITPFMLTTTEEEFKETIRRYEPRVKDLYVEMIPSQNKNTIEVQITFSTDYDMSERNALKFNLVGNEA